MAVEDVERVDGHCEQLARALWISMDLAGIVAATR